MASLVLSLFPGIGLLDMAFEREGFTVVRGPDSLWGGDIHVFHAPAGHFDGVIGGPPCQQFSRLAHLVRHNGYELAPNLISEFERVVLEAQPAWFLMENVRAAPEPAVLGYKVRATLFNNRWAGGEQNRLRRFSFGTKDGRDLMIVGVALEAVDSVAAVLASGGARPVPVAIGGSGKRKTSAARNLGYKTRAYAAAAALAQGLPADFLDDAPFTMAGKIKAIGNGVPLPLGSEVARAVKRAMAAQAPVARCSRW